MHPWHLFSAGRVLCAVLSLYLLVREATHHERVVRAEHAEMLSLCPSYASRLAEFGEDCERVRLIVEGGAATRTLPRRLWRYLTSDWLGHLTLAMLLGPWLQWLTCRAYHWLGTRRDVWQRHFTVKRVKKFDVEAFIHSTVQS